VRTNMQHTSLDAYEEITTKPTVLAPDRQRSTRFWRRPGAADLEGDRIRPRLGDQLCDRALEGTSRQEVDHGARAPALQPGWSLTSTSGAPRPVVDAPRPTSTRGAKTTRPRKSKVTPIAVIPSAERGKPIQLALELPQKAA